MDYYDIYRTGGMAKCLKAFKQAMAELPDEALLIEIEAFNAFSCNLNNCITAEEVDMKYEDVINWWKQQGIVSSAELKLVLENFSILFACNSNGIEGSSVNYHTTRDIFEGNKISNFSGTAREIFETQNQKFAFDFMLKAFDVKESISIDFVLKLHSLLMYGCYDENRWRKGERPGKFKVHDYCVGVADVGSYPDEVETDLTELLAELRQAETGDVLTKAAYLHAIFETIHPFADGNGRVGRALTNYYLLQQGHPPIVIYSEDRETYYLALEVFNRTGKLDGFVQFLKEQTVKTWKSKVAPRSIKSLSAFL